MNYLLKNNKKYKFDNNIIVEEIYEANNIEVCLEETGFNLFDKLDKSKAKLDENLLKIGKTKIKTIEANLPHFIDEYYSEFEIDLKLIKEANKFVDKKGTRPALSGVYINSLGTIIATDSFKLYIYDKGNSNEYVILSQELVNELCKFSNEKALLKFNKTAAKIILDNANTIITGRLINSQYPNVFNLINVSNYTKLNFNKYDFQKIADIGKLVNGEITVLFENDEITFIGDNSYNCEFNSNIESYVMFENINLALSVYDEDNVGLFYLSKEKPLIFNKNNKYVMIMIMRW